MCPASPGDSNVICHFCGCQSPHAYTCGDCRHEFCLSCVSTAIAQPPQKIYCPACGGFNIQPNSDTEKS